MSKSGKNIELLGPGTDLAITLLGVLLLIIAINERLREQKDEQLESIKKEQLGLIKDITKEYKRAKYIPLDDNETFHLYFDSTQIEKKKSPNIVFNNDATLQRIRFSEEILFNPAEYKIEERSAKVALTKVGNEIFNRIGSIKEIIIEGHTDNDRINTDSTDTFYSCEDCKVKSNLHLGMERALEVFKFLETKTKLDPSRHLISASTYGEYKPVPRNSEGDVAYNANKIAIDNSTPEDKALNRRIDIYLNYRPKYTESIGDDN